MLKEALEKLSSDLSSDELRKLRQIAGVKSQKTQKDIAYRMDVSVSSLRKIMKDENIKWRPEVRKIVRKPVTNRTNFDYYRNPMYHNPRSSSEHDAPYGSGKSYIR